VSTRLLSDAGSALFGPRWQVDLARALGVSDRTMRRWAAGETDPPRSIWTDVDRLCTERAQELDDVAARCRRHFAEQS
jgi:hypothetical protein